MKKVFKVLLIIVTVVVLAVAGILAYVKAALPNLSAATDLKIEYTKERIERGHYLANYVTVCVDCHSTRDYSKFAAPGKEGTLGQGGELFGTEAGFPGNFYAANITPLGIGKWTDGELFRTLTTGVSQDGHALFPVMPYTNFGKLDKEDIYSIIAYVRTLEPIESVVPKSSANFPMNFIINTIPKEATFSTIPAKTDLIAYGKYMFTASSCNECHTPQDKGQPIEGKYLAGGFKFPMLNGTVVFSANITQDKETGIGTWNEDQFLARFRVYSDSTFVPSTVGQGDFQTVMPWLFYCHMTDEDLKAIYAYLKTVPAVNNKINKFEKIALN